MEQAMLEQIESLYRLYSSETNHVYFTNHVICCRTFDVRVPEMPVLFAGNNYTAPQVED